jgi:hypothetical protein
MTEERLWQYLPNDWHGEDAVKLAHSYATLRDLRPASMDRQGQQPSTYT